MRATARPSPEHAVRMAAEPRRGWPTVAARRASSRAGTTGEGRVPEHDRRRRFAAPFPRGPDRLDVGPDVAIDEPSGQTRSCSGGAFRKGDSLSLVLASPCLSMNVRRSSGCRCVQTCPHVRHARKGSGQETPRPHKRKLKNRMPLGSKHLPRPCISWKRPATTVVASHFGQWSVSMASTSRRDYGALVWSRTQAILFR
jgi:hypothetical protein